MNLPTFIIGGAMKSGTTSLHYYLQAHPQVFIPEHPQELHFFDTDENFARGLEWYLSHFYPAAPEHKAIGQTSPLYLYHPKAPARIAEALPGVKLIFILRNPVDRAFSQYWHAIKKGYERLSFEEALDVEEARLAKDAFHRMMYSYVDRGKYAEQLDRYLSLFDKKNILILLSEDMGANPTGAIDQCCEFLGIEKRGADIMHRLPKTRYNETLLPRSMWLQRTVARFPAPLQKIKMFIAQQNLREAVYPPMAPETRQRLAQFFAPHNRRLAELFTLNLSAWED